MCSTTKRFSSCQGGVNNKEKKYQDSINDEDEDGIKQGKEIYKDSSKNTFSFQCDVNNGK